jgi:hypothetical protein
MAVRHEVEVGQDFRLRREPLGPVPLLPDLGGEVVAVVDAVDVDARPRIAVVVPDPADSAGPLDAEHR